MTFAVVAVVGSLAVLVGVFAMFLLARRGL